jgi:hypothetical protein
MSGATVYAASKAALGPHTINLAPNSPALK